MHGFPPHCQKDGFSSNEDCLSAIRSDFSAANLAKVIGYNFAPYNGNCAAYFSASDKPEGGCPATTNGGGWNGDRLDQLGDGEIDGYQEMSVAQCYACPI